MPRKDNSYLPLRRRFQRRQHALVPHRSFHPRPMSAVCLCALSNPSGHYRRYALLPLWFSPIHLPAALPSARFCFPHLSRLAPLRYYGDSDLLRRSPTAQVSPLTAPHLPVVPSPTTWAAWTSLHPPRQRAQRFSDFAMNEQARRSSPPNRVRSPTDRQFASGLPVPSTADRLLPTSPYDDAVSA